MNENGQMRETFTRGVGLAGDIGTLVAVTHHAGSSTNGTFYAHHNHRGDVVLARCGTTSVSTYEYSAFGNLKLAVGNDVCRFKSASKERDISTGFSYYGFRFYAPQWQRWVRRDPVREEGGLNLYGFVNNNPIAYFDALGLTLYKCTRQSQNAPKGAQHVYLYDDTTDRSCGMGGNFWRQKGVDNRGDRGPKSGHKCEEIPCSKGKAGAVMNCCSSKKTYIWRLFTNDCHTFIGECLEANGLPDPEIFGRFFPHCELLDDW